MLFSDLYAKFLQLSEDFSAIGHTFSVEVQPLIGLIFTNCFVPGIYVLLFCTGSE